MNSFDEVFIRPNRIRLDDVFKNPPFKNWKKGDFSDSLRDKVENYKKEVFDNSEPRATYSFYKTDEINIEKQDPPEGLLSSDYLVLGALTIGRKINRDQIKSSGNLVVDALENIILSEFKREVAYQIKGLSDKRGFNTTRLLTPGSGNVDWAVKNQRWVAENVNLDQIDVELNSSGFLVPEKSTVLVMGVGREIDQAKNLFTCKGCKREDCDYYKES
ncbi:MAG: hypothetical protein BTN85_0104 [Candidatus Methanohalarchaeum thermophilum]|uniref:Vitamin B12 dependent methionine synthase, activation domain n=1 Tax=Methanohalarchaeum thermophilum TaxID=1903181 RepID=A0A1Q6DTG2_METT1|nr:MAG: hypothetical protein BTN85_0104 [Candidatus Methanohalarchaeum thermophilum]